MSNKLYVGGLSYSTTNETLETLFQEIGPVVSAVVVMDRDSGRSKGFGFIEMQSDKEAAEAVAKFDGTELDGRTIRVNEARPKETRSSFSRY